MDDTKQITSGRTSAPCDTETQTSNLELRGFLQPHNRQMPPTSQVGHSQLDTLAPPAAHRSGRPGARRASLFIVRISRSITEMLPYF